MTVREVHYHLFVRYVLMMSNSTSDKFEGEFSIAHARWMANNCLSNIDSYPVDKLGRWMGYVQCILCLNGITTTTKERDYSRPLFHQAYANEGQGIPPTVEFGQ